MRSHPENRSENSSSGSALYARTLALPDWHLIKESLIRIKADAAADWPHQLLLLLGNTVGSAY